MLYNEGLSQPPDITPLPQCAFPSNALDFMTSPSSIDTSSDEVDEQRWPDAKVGQMVGSLPKSPTVSLFQPVLISGLQGERGSGPWACTWVRPPGTRKRYLIVYLSALCLCLFVLASVLMILFLKV